jgi:hypothetical protein
MNKYYALKKNKNYADAEKYIRNHVIQYDINLGFCLLADLCKEIQKTKLIIDFL